MRIRYVVFNPRTKAVQLGDKAIPAAGFSKVLDRDEVDFLLPELKEKRLHLFRLSSVDTDGRKSLRDPVSDRSPVVPTEASPRQRELYRQLSGHYLPENTTRITASELIDGLMKAKMEAAEHAEEIKAPRVTPTSEQCLEVLAGRLYLAHAPHFPKEMDGTTIVINFSGVPVQAFDNIFVMNCPADDNVDEQVLAGVVRFCAAGIRGIKQRILVYGSPDVGFVVAACVLREHLGIPAEKAVQIVRRVQPSALDKSELIETVEGYRVT